MRFNRILFFIFLSLILWSCEKDNILPDEEANFPVAELHSSVQPRTLNQEKDFNFILQRYGLEFDQIDNNTQRLYNSDGLFLDIIEVRPNEKYILSGTIIHDEIGLIVNQNGENFNEIFLFTDTSFQDVLTDSELGYRIANDENLFRHRPFGECFKDEWTDFCDGFISCVAQISHPWTVAGAVSIFCAFLDN